MVNPKTDDKSYYISVTSDLEILPCGLFRCFTDDKSYYISVTSDLEILPCGLFQCFCVRDMDSPRSKLWL